MADNKNPMDRSQHPGGRKPHDDIEKRGPNPGGRSSGENPQKDADRERNPQVRFPPDKESDSGMQDR
jgi:hypothetical protein